MRPRHFLAALVLVLAFMLFGLLSLSITTNAAPDNPPLRRTPILPFRRTSSANSADSTTSENTTTVETLTVDGIERQYRLHIPASYDPSQPTPLVISLHGFSSNAAQQEQLSQFSVKADDEGFIVVYPEGSGSPERWYFGPGENARADEAFIRQIITELEGRYKIDASQIYVNGISNGAEMSYRLACDLADKIAAFGLVSGGYPPFKDCQPGRAVPIVVFHGTADRLLPFNGDPPLMMSVPDFVAGWAAQNGCDVTPQVTYSQGDVTGQTWGNCRDNADVVFYTIADKGHSWPGSAMPALITTQDINATDAMWDFFVAHPYLPSSSRVQ